MKVFLFGFMGSGKTTYGKVLAKELKLEFMDLDDYIEKKIGRTIKHIFEVDGEQRFREIEHEALKEIVKKDDFLLATGGGAPCFFDNIEIMKKNGTTVYLETEVNVLANRLFYAKLYRPLIWGKTLSELKIYIEKMLEKRNPYYKKAHIITDGKDLDVDKLKNNILKRKKLKILR